MPMNVLAVWTSNSGGIVSPIDDDYERVRIAFVEISIKRIFGGPMSQIILFGNSFKLQYWVFGEGHICEFKSDHDQMI